MNIEDVRKRVQEICDCSWDDEKAHILEDQLHRDVLSQLSESGIHMPELAREALKTLSIDFARQCS